MREEITIKVAGQAGQGIETIGQALCLIYKASGFNIFANQDYMSRIRGGNNFFQIRVSGKPLYTLRKKSDIVVALDAPSVEIHKADMNDGANLVLDKNKFGISKEEKIFFDIPMFETASRIGGSDIFINSYACGVISAMTGVEFNHVENTLKSIFSDKQDEIIKKNIDVARQGYDFVVKAKRNNAFQVKPGEAKDCLLMNGNDALSLGAVRAGCKFYSAYPMTPSTGIMNNLAHFAREFNIVVEQAEDEIAAINMAIGASFAGARAMTGTSGGGFSLMVEGVSLAGMTETPVVIVEAQRPAPATGFPTRTEQADLEFVLHAGHGEFARAVFTPGTIEEAFYLTIKAFNIAEKYQIPVFIMTDQHLADSARDIDMFDLNKEKAARYIISKEGSKNITNYKRYQLNDSGISPRAIPSWMEEVFYVDSDEHTEEGHITEDALIRTAMVEKRLYKKLQGLKQEIEKPVTLNVKGADLVLIGFGSTFGALKETSGALKNKKIGFIHLPQVWPFPEKEIIELLEGAKKTISVENNAQAQLARLIRRETGIKIDKSILKFDGRPFDLDFLVEKLNQEA